MPKVDLEQLPEKKTPRPELNEAMEQVDDTKPERIALAVPAHYARKVKAAAKARGLTIKQFVMQALDAQYPNL